MFTTGMGPIADTFFALTTMLIAIPTGVKIFNWLGTVWGGSIQFKTPMYFALGFIAMFIIGGLSGVMHSSPPADLQQTDTYFIVAHFHYVLFGGSIFGIFGGRLLLVAEDVRPDAGRAAGQDALLADAHRLQPDVLPDAHPRAQRHAAPGLHLPDGPGLRDAEPDRDGRRVHPGALVPGLPRSTSSRPARSRANAPADPWNGATLEWSIPSPPPEYNFAEVPTVHGRDPLWEAKRAARRSRCPEPPRVSGAGHPPAQSVATGRWSPRSACSA